MLSAPNGISTILPSSSDVLVSHSLASPTDALTGPANHDSSSISFYVRRLVIRILGAPTADAAPDASPTPTSHLSPSVSLYVVSLTTRVLLVSTPLELLPRELLADVFAPSPAMTPSSSSAVLTRWSRRRVR